MRIIPCCVLIVHLFTAGVAHSQTFDHLQVLLGGYTLSTDGGEKPIGVWLGSRVVIGKVTIGTFSVGDCGYFAASSDGTLRENATTAWRIEFTPIRVVRDAVTFRLRWVRSLDSSKAFTVSNEDIELTLRPGESRPMDSVPVSSGAKTFDGRACKASAASVRVSVDNYPSEEVDRRLIAADLWLIERSSSGTERSQLLSVRGLPNRPIPFYFDSIINGKVSLEIHGRLVARPESGAMEVSVETRARWGEGSPVRSVRSVIQVKPEEIVEGRLPKLGESAGPFANREYSIRIRARQLR